MYVIKETCFFTAALRPDAESDKRRVGQSEDRTEQARDDLERYISISKIQVTATLDHLLPGREFGKNDLHRPSNRYILVLEKTRKYNTLGG
jgi:hypothetical protein